MKVQNIFILIVVFIFAAAAIQSQTKDNAKQETNVKKTDCAMDCSKSDCKDMKKSEKGSKDCCANGMKSGDKCTDKPHAKCDKTKKETIKTKKTEKAPEIKDKKNEKDQK